MKSSVVLSRNGVLWIRAMSITEDELWVGDGPVTLVLAESDAAEKGDSIYAALQKSRTVPHSTSWNEPSVTLRAAGSKSWSAFQRCAKNVAITLDEEMALVPSRYDKKESMYIPLPEKTVVLPKDASPAELGEALELALTRCE